MKSPRQPFTATSSLRAGVAGIALSALSACSFLPIQSGPTIYAGTHTARNDSAVQTLHNGWQVDPASTVTLTTRSGYAAPVVAPGSVTLKRPLTAEETTLAEQCNKTANSSFHAQCAQVSPPSHLVYELRPQLVYAGITCGRTSLVKGSPIPGMSGSESFARTTCKFNGAYDVKSAEIPNRSIIVARPQR